MNETVIKYILESKKKLAGDFEFAGNARKAEEEGFSVVMVTGDKGRLAIPRFIEHHASGNG